MLEEGKRIHLSVEKKCLVWQMAKHHQGRFPQSITQHMVTMHSLHLLKAIIRTDSTEKQGQCTYLSVHVKDM